MLDQDKSSIVVEIVTWLVKVSVEGLARWAGDIVAMCIEPEVGRWFGFAHILMLRAFEAVAKVNAIGAFAV